MQYNRVAAGLLLLSCLQLGRTCQESGFCSQGEVKPFFGNIFSGEGLKAALEARSFRQEVILMVTDRKRIDGFLQGTKSLYKLGFHHVLLLAMTKDECELVNTVVPEVGCGWTTFKSPSDLTDVYVLWNLRYRTLARAMRLGYNVLLLDTDITIYEDPYRYFKQPPFNDIVVINQEEGHTAANGGVLYVQNASPDGPASFMFAEIVARPLRWMDDDWATASKIGLHRTCLYMDQDAYADVLQDMASGYLLFPKAWWCLHEEKRAEPKWVQVDAKMQEYINAKETFTTADYPVPADWHNLTGGPTTAIRTVNMRMPNCRGWPEELGGKWYPDERGQFSNELLQQLHDDCPECPMWPDAEDPNNAAAADAVPTEKFAIMPYWLGTSYWNRGRQGYWNPHLTGGAAQQVIAHTHYNPIADTAINKYTVPMAFGVYDWGLAKQAKGDLLYTACSDSPYLPSSESCSDLKVLAFTPDAEKLLGSTGSWQEFALLLQGLTKLAHLLGRAVAWPSLPCNTTWVSKGRPTEKTPIHLGAMWLHWTASDGQLMCTPWEVARSACLCSGKGMLPFEWHHFQQQHTGNASQGNSPKNMSQVTLHALHAETDAAASEKGFELLEKIVDIVSLDELQGPASLEDEPVLFLDSLVHIDLGALPGAESRAQSFESAFKECTLLNTTAIVNRYSPETWDDFGGFALSQPEGARLAHKPARLRKGRIHRHLHIEDHHQTSLLEQLG